MLNAQSREAADAALLQRFADGWLRPDHVEWQYDRAGGVLSLKAAGTADLDWDKAGTQLTYYLPGGGFYKPAKLERVASEDQTAPYANDPQRFTCSVTRVQLPKIPGAHWSITAPPEDSVIGGIAYYRSANLKSGVVNLVRSTRTVQMELSPLQALAANRVLPGFNDNKSWVETESGPSETTDGSDARLPDSRTVNWGADSSLCRSPSRE